MSSILFIINLTNYTIVSDFITNIISFIYIYIYINTQCNDNKYCFTYKL